MFDDFDDDELEETIQHSLLFVGAINVYNSIRTRHRLTRSAVVEPALSPWQHLLQFGDDQSFTEMTGFDRITFHMIANTLFPIQNRLIPKLGRPYILDHLGQLGLFLFYVGSTMKIKHICMIFGIVPSSCSDIINRIMIKVIGELSTHFASRIQFPNEEEKERLAALVALRQPGITNVIGFMDGLGIHVECENNPDVQNAYYNGYASDTMCQNIFCFGATGKVILCATNYPGSWHDATVSADIVDYIIRNIGTYAICVDQGFPRSGRCYDVLLGPISQRESLKLSPILSEALLERASMIVSLRQASEWGMRGLQGTFPRLKSRLTSDKTKRGNIIMSIVLLNNFRTHFMGLNQITTVFSEFYEQYCNLNTYDRIGRYFYGDLFNEVNEIDDMF